MELTIGAQLGNYRLLRMIGVGGFAQVYLAEHIYLETQAAIKVLGFSANRERFLKEAQTIARLRHPSIVSVMDFGVEQEIDRPFLVMEYAPHGSLRTKHSKGTPLPLATVASYVQQVAAALQYAHQHKVVHCDVKPENMLIGADQQILLSDFGIARVVQNTLQSHTTKDIVGTIYYMAPEQFAGRAVPASDQYALGVVVYEWLSGQTPFDGNNIAEIFYMHTRMEPLSLHLLEPAIPAAVDEVVMKALMKEPRQRFPDIAAFASAFEQAAQLAPSSFTIGFSSNAQGISYNQQPTLPDIVLSQPSLPTPINSIETLLPSLRSYLPVHDPAQSDRKDIEENLATQFASPHTSQPEPAPPSAPPQSTEYSLIAPPLPTLTEMLPPAVGIPDDQTLVALPSAQDAKPAPDHELQQHPLSPPSSPELASGLLPTLVNYLPPSGANQAEPSQAAPPSSEAADIQPELEFDAPTLPETPEDQSPTILLPHITGLLTRWSEPPATVWQPAPFRPVLQQVEIFISYSHKDRNYRERLYDHLIQIKYRYPAAVWNDTEIRPGVDIQQEVEKNLQKAHIILLLVSSHFIASDYCREKELKTAMERHHLGKAQVIPVILKPTLWQIAPFGNLLALPRDGKPISSWKPSDAGYADVAKGIEKLIREMLGISPGSKH